MSSQILFYLGDRAGGNPILMVIGEKKKVDSPSGFERTFKFLESLIDSPRVSLASSLLAKEWKPPGDVTRES